MRTFRSRTTVLAASGAAVLALSLTACGGSGTGVRSSGAAEETTTVKLSAAQGSGSGGSAGSKASSPVCTTGDMSVSAARRGGPPYTHIVLTAKNTSDRSCTMAGFPEIQFLESHRENVPPVAKSKPAAPVVLKAGAPAYALVKLSDGGAHEENEIVTDFSVTLQGGGGMTAVKAPGEGGIAVDPATWATGYWTYELRNGADDF